MARRNTTTRNSPHAINAINYVSTTDAISNTTGQGGSPRNLTSIWEKLNSMCFDIEWTIGTDAGDAIVLTAQLIIQSDSDGKIVTSISETTGADYYKVQITVGDRVFQSPLITFAA